MRKLISTAMAIMEVLFGLALGLLVVAAIFATLVGILYLTAGLIDCSLGVENSFYCYGEIPQIK